MLVLLLVSLPCSAAEGPRLLLQKAHFDPVTSVACSPDGTLITTASEDTTAKLWRVESGKVHATFEGHRNIVTALAFSPDGVTLAAGKSNGIAQLWNTRTGALMETVCLSNEYNSSTRRINAVAFSPSEKVLTLSFDGEEGIGLWDFVEKKESAFFVDEQKNVTKCLAFTPDGRKLVAGNYSGTAVVWDMGLKKPSIFLKGLCCGIGSVAFTTSGQYLIVRSMGSRIKIWNLATPRFLTSGS